MMTEWMIAFLLISVGFAGSGKAHQIARIIAENGARLFGRRS